MNVAVWIVSGLLAAAYLAGGIAKLTQPLDRLRGSMGWVDDIPGRLVRSIGALEVLGALGLVLPKLLDVVDDRSGVDGTLSGLAATGLLAIQVLAVPVHLRRKEAAMLPVNIVYAALAGFVAAARLGWL